MVKQFATLLIDDDKDTQEIFQAALVEKHKLPLAVISSAEGALNYLEKNRPDIIVIDLYLLSTDGYKLLKQIREGDLNPECPIVATTAYYSHREAGYVLLHGFDGYLEKPLNAADLPNYLEKLVFPGDA
jgi:CheY-like chemotaxis protein